MVILKVGVGGLEVVVPKRFGNRRLPGILEANREWIEKELRRVKESPSFVVPECINLNAIDERWQVNYQSRPTLDGRFSVEACASNRILVEGDLKGQIQLGSGIGNEEGLSVEITFSKSIFRGEEGWNEHVSL